MGLLELLGSREFMQGPEGDNARFVGAALDQFRPTFYRDDGGKMFFNVSPERHDFTKFAGVIQVLKHKNDAAKAKQKKDMKENEGGSQGGAAEDKENVPPP